MSIHELGKIFNQSLARVFDLRKCFFIFLALVFSGLIFIIFQAVAIHTPNWLKLPLIFFPLFMLFFLLMASGSIAMQIYDLERSGKKVAFTELIFASRFILLKSCWCALPIACAFFALWILLGIGILIKSIPYLGPFLGVILAFVPFILNFCILLLICAALLALFFITPLISFKKKIDKSTLTSCLGSDIFTHLLLFFTACIPLWIVWFFASHALLLTFSIYSFGDTDLEKVLQSLFMLIPFAAIMTFGFTFFFNFSFEAYLRTKEDNKPQEECV